MRRTKMLQEIRKMRFEEVYFGWSKSRLSQEEVAQILGVCDRTFRRSPPVLKWSSIQEQKNRTTQVLQNRTYHLLLTRRGFVVDNG